jgi:hypothetical protein
MGWLTVREQHRAILEDFSEFRLVADCDWFGIWEGVVQPIAKPYRIRIIYYRYHLFDDWEWQAPFVQVHVIDPPIGALALAAGKRLPHIYGNPHDPAMPALCLYDPETSWTGYDYIASTIIPWASEWLFHYEYWKISGEFLGLGIHPTASRQSCSSSQDSSQVAPAQRAPFPSAAFHRFGRKTGVFASFPLMAAASGVSSLPRCWRDLKGTSPAAIRSQIISILSPAPPRAALSPSVLVPVSLPQRSAISMSSAAAKSSRPPAPIALAA